MNDEPPGPPVDARPAHQPRPRRFELARTLTLVADVVAILAAYWMTLQGWSWLHPELAEVAPIPFLNLLLLGLIVPPAAICLPMWLLIAARLNLYDPQRNVSSPRLLQMVTEGVALYVVGVIIVAFLLPQQHFGRVAAALLGFSTLLTVSSLRLAVFWWVQTTNIRGVLPQRVAIVGTRNIAGHVCNRIRAYERLGFEVVGFIDDVRASSQREITGQPIDPTQIIGTIYEIRDLVNRHNINLVVLSDFAYPRLDAVRLAVELDRMGVRLLKVPYLHGVVSSRIVTQNIGDLELEVFRPVAYPPVAYRVKRAVDIFVVVLGGTLILPLLAITALAIKLGSPGPVFYLDRRYGKGGRLFNVFKFRSMVVDAEARKKELAERNEADGMLFKMENDPRITRVGRLIRMCSIDELPQIFNVLIGDMNLVGPRPLPMDDVTGLDGKPEWRYWFDQRSNVKPGITGLWQVMGRSDLGFDRMVELDIYYIEHWSLWLDLQILLKTIPVVLFRRGAK